MSKKWTLSASHKALSVFKYWVVKDCYHQISGLTLWTVKDCSLPNEVLYLLYKTVNLVMSSLLPKTAGHHTNSLILFTLAKDC